MDIYQLTEEINGLINKFESIPLNEEEELYVLYSKLFLEHCGEVPRFMVLKNGTILLDT